MGPEPAAAGAVPPAVVANLHGFYAAWARKHPGGAVHPGADRLVVDTGEGVELAQELNVAFIERVDPSEDRLALGSHYFRSRSRPWRLEGPPELRVEVERRATELGLGVGRLRPGMLVAPAALRPGPDVPGLEVERVVGLCRLATFTSTLVEGMGGAPVPDLPPIAREPAGTDCYLGLLGGEPVATAIRYSDGGVAGIYGVATLARARRRGIGRAMTEHALRDGFAVGDQRGFLQATEIGRPLYEAMGFRWAFDRLSWPGQR